MVREDIRHYLRLSAWVRQSVDAVDSDLERWIGRLRARDVTAIPHLPIGAHCSPSETYAHNELNLLMLQASSFPNRLAHSMRNLTGVRPHKA